MKAPRAKSRRSRSWPIAGIFVLLIVDAVLVGAAFLQAHPNVQGSPGPIPIFSSPSSTSPTPTPTHHEATSHGS